MHKLNQEGSLVIPLVITGSLLVVALLFGFWAFAGMQDYKNNSDEKSAEAVKVAEEQLTIQKDEEFAEKEKSPYVNYLGPSTFGSLSIDYPKSWSAYIDEMGKGSTPVNGYIHPKFVPALTSETSFALRFEIVNTTNENVMKQFDSANKAGKVTISAYRAPKVDSVLGSRVEGEILPKKQGAIVVLPLRDKAIKVWTEGQEFRADFNTMLETLTFVP